MPTIEEWSAEAVDFVRDAIDVFIAAARKADTSGDQILAAVFLRVAYRTGVELYGFDVWTARWEVEYPIETQ